MIVKICSARAWEAEAQFFNTESTEIRRVHGDSL